MQTEINSLKSLNKSETSDAIVGQNLPPKHPVPEILAPVGGRAQFFAALHSGADAVFLGLKQFNARARAENFTIEELRELVPLAHLHEMKVLVTLNILIKNIELEALIAVLNDLADVNIDALIIQDIGVAKIVNQYFPELRMHASTQLAVHNLAGVKQARELGFKRVVLARELTALEIRKIREALPVQEVEIEAFCHGSLCYSYSGLCFFSGAQDARSGNRGECAYTCRKPYRILNEPGHGLLFSMKDLNTSDNLDMLVGAGVDTLKIEGRKKDPQYVSTVVRLYRSRLDALYGYPTLRRAAPAVAHALPTQLNESDLAFSFQRESTTFFLKGRYAENVIDLDNPTHKGLRIGEIQKITGQFIRVFTECSLEKFDGLRIDPASQLYHSKPQHGEAPAGNQTELKARYNNDTLQFSLREMTVQNQRTTAVDAGHFVEILLPENLTRLPAVGDVLFKTRSDALKKKVEALASAPLEQKLRPWRHVDLNINVVELDSKIQIEFTFLKRGLVALHETAEFEAQRPRQGNGTLQSDFDQVFSIWGDIDIRAEKLTITGDLCWFIPKSMLKKVKQSIAAKLPECLDLTHLNILKDRTQKILGPKIALKKELALGTTQFSIKIDRPEFIDIIGEYCKINSDFNLNEIIFEPKRNFLKTIEPQAVANLCIEKCKNWNFNLRIALPTVIRAWDEPLLKRWIAAFAANGINKYEVGNVGALENLKSWGIFNSETHLQSDFTLFSLNKMAVQSIAEQGVKSVCLSLEDDHENLKSLLNQWPQGTAPLVILYKDTPLFIAESCSLTALHGGCPTAAVCGYRTLEIENDEGEQFFAAHENCKTVVYGKEAFSLTQHRKTFESWGVRHFRIDFLTRPYTPEAINGILTCTFLGKPVSQTHSANFERRLL